MKRRSFIQTTGAAGLSTLLNSSGLTEFITQEIGSELETNFTNPSNSAYSRTFWPWMNGNVTKAGITLDLEAMKKIGIAGVFNFDVGTGIPKGPVKYLSEEWLALKKHAINEAARLDLEFTMHNCPGWSSSGGPWITPALAMQQITWSEAYLSGGREITTRLAKPAHKFDHYHDIAVIAFPSLEGEELLQTVHAHSNAGPVDMNDLKGEDPTGVTVHPSNNKDAWLQFEFAKPYEARLLTFFISAPAGETSATKPVEFGERTSVLVESSDDGVRFSTVTQINTGLETELLLGDKLIVFDIPVTKAKYFRISSAKARRYKQVQFSGIHRLRNWLEKTNHRARTFMYVSDRSTIENTNDQSVAASSVVDLNAVLDLSQQVDQTGSLRWNVPAGNWTILRIGFTAIGTLNRSAPDAGVGLECDKYNPEAITFHFNKMMENLLPAINSMAGKKKMGLEIDSYEVGCQNWTPGFEQEFHRKWGYSILKYLPIVAGGRIVGSVDITERFLWDLRRLQADMIAKNYYGRFQELCHKHGFKAYIQPYESGPMEEMQIGSRADMNIGEFLNGISSAFPAKTPVRRTPKLAASIAHINGQKIVAVEAFTSEPDSGRWQEYPFALKALSDKIFTKGINQMIIHRFAHQPHPTAVPGMTMGPWGIHFDRTNTWWYQGNAWMQYLARCQAMLQSGSFSADLLYFTGEDANMYTRATIDELTPAPPAGYDYDLVNAEVLLQNAKIEANQIDLGHGITYRILILQDFKGITLTLLRKLRSLVQDGMILVGAKPERSLGLADYRDADAEFKLLADELWKKKNDIIDNNFGKGRVLWGEPIRSILRELNIEPDFEYTSRSGDASIVYTHRKLENGDAYFVSNQRRTYEELTCAFRVKNKRPELWNPVTGEIIPVKVYELVDDRLRMPLQLEPYGSVFVVFRNPASQVFFHSIRKDGDTILSTRNFLEVARPQFKDVYNNFSICIWAKPEINILLDPVFSVGTIAQPWTDFYALYPSPGHDLYGKGHATCGITIGRNGAAIWENKTGDPILVLPATVAIEGWTFFTVQYADGVPAIYVNGQLAVKGKKNNSIVHPGESKSFSVEDVSCYNGDMNKPVFFNRVLREDEIHSLSKQGPQYEVTSMAIEPINHNKPAIVIKQNGVYILQTNTGQTSSFTISNIAKPFEIRGTWQVRCPNKMGASTEFQLPTLVSLHKNPASGIKYFSGTITYLKNFSFAFQPRQPKRLLLDLGRVEVIAEVILNGKNLGILWKRPYRVDITSALQKGMNRLEIQVTNLWPNRLIGDEHYPDPDEFSRGGYSGRAGLIEGFIKILPDWYIKGQPKPPNQRITFTTWKHYTKESPLVESGLIGPVIIEEAVIRIL